MDKKSRDNKPKVCNPNNPFTGPGHKASFKGKNDADRYNDANQLNSNYDEYGRGKQKWITVD